MYIQIQSADSVHLLSLTYLLDPTSLAGCRGTVVSRQEVLSPEGTASASTPVIKSIVLHNVTNIKISNFIIVTDIKKWLPEEDSERSCSQNSLGSFIPYEKLASSPLNRPK